MSARRAWTELRARDGATPRVCRRRTTPAWRYKVSARLSYESGRLSRVAAVHFGRSASCSIASLRRNLTPAPLRSVGVRIDGDKRLAPAPRPAKNITALPARNGVRSQPDRTEIPPGRRPQGPSPLRSRRTGAPETTYSHSSTPWWKWYWPDRSPLMGLVEARADPFCVEPLAKRGRLVTEHAPFNLIVEFQLMTLIDSTTSWSHDPRQRKGVTTVPWQPIGSRVSALGRRRHLPLPRPGCLADAAARRSGRRTFPSMSSR